MMSDDNGVQKIDLDKVDWRGSREFFESLGEALDRLDDKDESFDFTWVGKRKSIIEAGAPINKTFRPDVEASKNWNTTKNLFIEGDNLDALKLLQESYLGKVKMIYIDPPYNTGKDFVYHDNFKASTEQYDEDTEYKDDAGNIQFKKNEKTNGRYHSDWLSMMYPRLKLARNLLTEDGVIFISIDDNEQANLRKLCDEVFGEDNFVGNIVVAKGTTTGQDANDIGSSVDYMLVFARDKTRYIPNGLPLNEKDIARFSLEDNKGKYSILQFRKTGTNDRRQDRPNLYYPLIAPDGSEVYPIGPGGYESCWRTGRKQFDSWVAEGMIEWKIDQTGVYKPYVKYYLEGRTKQVSNLWDDVEGNKKASITVKELVGKNVFTNPKPVGLIKKCLIITTGEDDLILDFFSGSGSTAHAVMQLNAEDGGNRKWIMVQLPEETDEKSEAFKAGYKTIPEISRERIHRAGDKIASERPDAKVDYGFRSLLIDDTNYKEVYKSAGQYSQAELLDAVDNIKEDRSDLDLLYGVLTQSALELNRPIETVELSGSTTYKYDYFGGVSGLIACFAENISEATIKEIAKLKPLTAVFRESSFADSQAKVNLAEHFRILSPETKVKVV
ncbi:MAG: site-specific DNA-methyltransferase [Candidatus Nomurabacteria bacterium]|nr:MAG: site-specific DNA-methyltransferase [Candidatus Nomurabacteria bacterium]